MAATEPIVPTTKSMLIGRRGFLTRSAVAGAGLVLGPALIAAVLEQRLVGRSLGRRLDRPERRGAIGCSVTRGDHPEHLDLAQGLPAVRPERHRGRQPPVPASFAYFVPEGREYFTA